jgi:large subunit ribosomal protein L23
MKVNKLLVKRPIVTEKSSLLLENKNQYVFRVDASAKKIELKSEIEDLFGVNVVKLNLAAYKPKKKRVGKSTGYTSAWKKAFVTLKAEQTISVFE